MLLILLKNNNDNDNRCCILLIYLLFLKLYSSSLIIFCLAIFKNFYKKINFARYDYLHSTPWSPRGCAAE